MAQAVPAKAVALPAAAKTKGLAAAHRQFLHILVSGASGFIGRPLVASLKSRGDRVFRLVRTSTGGEDEIPWDPDRGMADRSQFEGFDAVIHLAGEPIAPGRWTEEKKKKIHLSRTVGTWVLSQILSQTVKPPRIFISPSAVGYYGDRGDEDLTEESGPGSTFLARVCVEWEQASASIAARGSRTVHPRFGLVLGRGGGALARLVPLYKMGLGGRVGSGKQWVSWVALSDLIRGIERMLDDDRIEGPCNLSSPHPIRQEEFAATLARILRRPAVLSQPAWILKLLFGQAAAELLLAGAKMSPAKLQRLGFPFQFPFLDGALRDALF